MVMLNNLTIRFSWIVVLSAFVLSCENVKDKKISEATMEQDIQKIRDSKQLSDEEMKLLASYIIRAKAGALFGGSELSMDKTVGQMIEEQRKWETERKIEEEKQKQLAEEAAREEERLAELLRNAVSVALYKKSLEKADYRSGVYSDYFLFGYVFKNLTKKTIRGFTGTIQFNDIFDKEIMKSNLSIDEPLAPNSTKRWQGTLDYNQFMDTHRKLANTDLENIKMVWLPDKVLFTDGTSIGKN
ncbi:MAG: hypothetical protein HBSIN02_24800 [Bacteroidia bacterium]|nr:MAG: hypothetical protein HBSIN02_24800 [Bacteroidia bacterium]